MAQVVAIRHVAFEDLGMLDPLLRRRGHQVAYLDAWRDDIESARDADLVVVLGGPIGAYQEDLFPFLAHERALLRERIQSDRAVLGICLGAQIMALAMGAGVAPGPQKELGYAPVDLTEAGRRSPLAWLNGLPVLHWHGDCAELPPGADLLARTDACPVQAFAISDHGLALQFHIETEASGVEAWLIGHSLEISQVAATGVGRLRQDAAIHSGALNAAAAELAREWLEPLGL